LRQRDSRGILARMRILTSLVALSVLAACATAPAATAPAPAASAPAVASSGVNARAVQLLAAAGRENAPTQADVERMFGAPDVSRQDGAGSALTYRTPSCGLLLVFAADQRNVMRLAQAHPSARRTGEAAPGLEICATEASARR
jgi:hypothetical protein